jgi:hypothetical protein
MADLQRVLWSVVATCLLTFATAHAADPLSAKRGYADTGGNYSGLQATNAGWYYTWGMGLGNPGDFDALQVPMFRSWTNMSTHLNWILTRPEPVEWVMCYNEPERSDQDNLTVAEAISRCTTISNGLAGSGAKLVTPAVSDTSDGKTWMSDFHTQAGAAGLTFDAVAFHWYGWSTPDNISQAFANFQGSVNWYHNLWNKPVFISEFAIHDWGGSYTDEEITEANRQFLDLAIPWLESTSYVEGYAWYTWFGDAHLFDGDPATPTPMGYEYDGVIKDGESYDLSGIDMGEHVAYLAGGKLTNSGGAPGTVRYISALPDVSSRIGGSTNWGMTEGNWIRVGTGATLVKTDSNQVVLDRSQVTNDGVLETSQGELVLRRRPTVTGTGRMRVGPAGTLTFDGLDRYGSRRFNFPIELDGGTVVGPADRGGVIAELGGELSGHGTVSGGLTAMAGATIRVGGTGIAEPSWSTIDDFQGYATGKLNAGVTGGVWTGVFDGTANAQIVSDGANRSLEYYGTGSSWRGALTSLRDSFAADDYSLTDGDTATYFFRVERQGTQTMDGIFGLTDQESIGIDTPWNELAVTLSLFQEGSTAGTTALRAYDSATSSDIVVRNNIGPDEWINVWLVVDNEAKTYQVATSTGSDDGTLYPTTFAFGRRSAAGAALDTFAGAEYRSGSNPANASVRIDDLVYLRGENLVNPLSGAQPGLALDPAVLTVEGNFTAQSGATLELDLFDPTAFDRLVVTGVLTAGGSLQVSLDPAAPSLQAGDAFDVLDFLSAAGEFDQLVLPTLAAGLRWDASQLYTSGLLAVVALLPGDFNNDGLVDAADYTVWRDNFGSSFDLGGNGDETGDSAGVVDEADFALWKANFGATAAAATSAQAVPEPSSVLIAVLGVVMACPRRRKC